MLSVTRSFSKNGPAPSELYSYKHMAVLGGVQSRRLTDSEAMGAMEAGESRALSEQLIEPSSA